MEFPHDAQRGPGWHGQFTIIIIIIIIVIIAITIINGALAGMVGSHHYRSVLVNIIMSETNMMLNGALAGIVGSQSL